MKEVMMIDTIKLIIPYDKQPNWLDMARLQRTFDPHTGRIKAYGNPTQSDKILGIYKPRVTYSEQVRAGASRTYQLAIELSLPKLIYGNNFSELSDSDFTRTVHKLSGTLEEHYGVIITPQQLEQAGVAKIDYSKNIIFTDRTPVSSIVSHMAKANIARTFDVQKTDFKNGGLAYHAKHTNSLDVVMYDKIADLKHSAVSEKRTEEKDSYVQKSLLEQLCSNEHLTVARFEVRLNRTRKLRDELISTGLVRELTFRELFSNRVSQRVLTHHWGRIFERIPKTPLDNQTVEGLLLNLKKTQPNITLTKALAIIGYEHLKKELDGRYVRNVAEELFSPSQYRRFMQRTRNPPPANQLKTLLTISNSLSEMKPVSILDYIV